MRKVIFNWPLVLYFAIFVFVVCISSCSDKTMCHKVRSQYGGYK